ncbi:pantoate--beta-alanine ligase [Algisphaera agarilytica]|uniref:Pantothenate synthetase n=1 Tax=Algisphaera agarilytica TaxID=1385975 RepID=A0A7X0LKU7_9BACT|nr:pantoate--beta-alanine ligase [Algisphaera agarilytica]MBB6429991.1 pantoate--beta-alanine ligase [Algisphaera agarilytica]
MLICRTLDELRQARQSLGGRVALVPTMGALHAGHLAHLGYARRAADHVVVSIFVNPTQFGPHEDFNRYPRTLEVDTAKCETAGADLVFAPEAETVYPPGVPGVELTVPGVADGLEGAQRPGHFAGVCRVVLKLLNLVRPDAVTFGRKDYQQLAVVSAMINDLMLPIDIIEVPTVREDDGLAMSSRNRYLEGDERKHALGLSKALKQAQQMAADGEPDPVAIEAMMRDVMQAYHLEVDYAAVRHARTLGEIDSVVPTESVALVAGRLGKVRLIDNAVLSETMP